MPRSRTVCWSPSAPTPPSSANGEAPYYRYGDVLLFEGLLEAPPRFADFDYREYLARQGIAAVMPFPRATLVEEGQGSWALGQVYALRHRLAASLQQGLPQPQAALAQAMLLGLRGDLPDDVREGLPGDRGQAICSPSPGCTSESFWA